MSSKFTPSPTLKEFPSHEKLPASLYCHILLVHHTAIVWNLDRWINASAKRGRRETELMVKYAELPLAIPCRDSRIVRRVLD
jgi:hypothetical protein